MIQEINKHFSQVLAEHGLDRRQCFTNVTSRPPDGRTVVCECSDRAALAELERRVSSEVAPGFVVEYVYLPSAGLPAGLIAASSVADVRKSPNHAAELVTQIIYGDAVEPLKEVGEWYLVRLDDGYVGYIRSWHLALRSPEEVEAYRRDAQHRVSVNNAEVLRTPEEGALPVSDLVIGTVVSAGDCGRRGWRAVRLPDGKEGFARSRCLEKLPARRRLSREKLSTTGLRFLGIPYIWGGTTPKGFDCSGLMQRIFRLNGCLIPRDADQQAAFGRDKAARDARGLITGDLLFFGSAADKITHVAMFLSEGLFLHAYGQVKIGSLDPTSNLFDSKLVRDWQITRDVISV